MKQEKIKYISRIVLIGFIIAEVSILIRHVLNVFYLPVCSNFPLMTDVTLPLYRMDNPEASNILINYFPVTFLFLKIMQIISFGNYEIVFIYIFSFVIFISIIISLKLIDSDNSCDTGIIFKILILHGLQFPMLFDIERGNIEILVYLFCLLFYYFYVKKNYNIASVCIAIAIGMKLYPAMFALMFVNKKDYKYFIKSMIIAGALSVVCYFAFVKGVYGDIKTYLVDFTRFNEYYLYDLSGLQYNHSLLYMFIGIGFFFIKESIYSFLVSSNAALFYSAFVMIIAFIIVIMTIVLKMKDWEKIAIYTSLMVLLPPVSFDYTLIAFMIPIISFITSDTDKKESILYSVLFGLILIPMSWVEFLYIKYRYDFGLIIRPLIMIIIVVSLLVSNYKRGFIDNKVKELKEGS